LSQNLTAFLTSLGLISLAELGDKTQLLIVNFSVNNKPIKILIGVIIGTFFSHGAAILVGSAFSNFDSIQDIIQILAYISFIAFGLISLFKKSKEKNESFKLINFGVITSVAVSIFIGELGDKTQLATIALSTEFPSSKLFLILGAVFGMVIADSIGIVAGIYMNKKIPKKAINTISSLVFILFGIIGLITF
jgi:putative Ca2+/H+ antiporter (TMEM165/GDT1 family)